MSDFDQLKIRRLDGSLLLVFRELLVHRRASEVAQRLGLSQSAISHALSRLRDLFGDPLFIRKSHGLEPTRRALELGPRIESLIDLIGATVSQNGRFEPKQSRRRFGIACPDHIATLMSDQLTAHFQRDAPNAVFSLRTGYLDHAITAVRRGEVDLAIGAFGQIPHDLSIELIYEDEYCVLARRGHPKIRGKLDGATYLTTGHVFVGNPDYTLLDHGALDRETVSTLESAYGPLPQPNEKLQWGAPGEYIRIRTHGYVSQWETAMFAVLGSNALAECPRRLAQKYARKMGLQVLDPPYGRFTLKIHAVRRIVADPGVDWLLDRVKAALQ